MDKVLGIFGVLVDNKGVVFLNREAWVDSEHFRGFGSRLLKVSRLPIGLRKPKMRRLQMGQARFAFAEQTHRLAIALEHVVGTAHPTCRVDERLKRIEAHVCLQRFDRSCRLTRTHQDLSESMINEIGIEREGSLEFGHGGVVLALVKQDLSKLSASLWQAVVEEHRCLRQFQSTIECSGPEIVVIERLAI